jgi:hypothetical protein
MHTSQLNTHEWNETHLTWLKSTSPDVVSNSANVLMSIPSVLNRWKSIPEPFSSSIESGAYMSSLEHGHQLIVLYYEAIPKCTHSRLNVKLNCQVDASGGDWPFSSHTVIPSWMTLSMSTLHRIVWKW